MADRGVHRTPYRAAAFLLAAAAANSAILDGRLSAQGVDWLGLRPSALCNVVYHFLTEYADEKERAKIDQAIMGPPTIDPTRADAWGDDATAQVQQQALLSMLG